MQSKYTRTEEESESHQFELDVSFTEDQSSVKYNNNNNHHHHHHHLTRWPFQLYKRLSIWVLAWVDFDEGWNWKTQWKLSKSDDDRLKLSPRTMMVQVRGIIVAHYTSLTPPGVHHKLFPGGHPSSFQPHQTGLKIRWTDRNRCLPLELAVLCWIYLKILSLQSDLSNTPSRFLVQGNEKHA